MHWCFEVRECVADGGDTAAFGVLVGVFPGGVGAVELHIGGEIPVLGEVVLECAPVGGCVEACLRVRGRLPGELPPGAVLIAAECGERVR